MNARDHAVKLSVIGAVKKFVDDIEAKAKADARAAFAPGDRISAATDDGTVVGVVTMTKAGEAKWKVVDPQKFLAWVKANRPTAIVESVRSSDQESILKSIESTGLIPDGVDMVPGSKPHLQVRPDHDVVRSLDWRGYLELGDGSTSEAATPVLEPAPEPEPADTRCPATARWNSSRASTNPPHDHHCDVEADVEHDRHRCVCGASWKTAPKES